MIQSNFSFIYLMICLYIPVYLLLLMKGICICLFKVISLVIKLSFLFLTLEVWKGSVNLDPFLHVNDVSINTLHTSSVKRF